MSCWAKNSRNKRKLDISKIRKSQLDINYNWVDFPIKITAKSLNHLYSIHEHMNSFITIFYCLFCTTRTALERPREVKMNEDMIRHRKGRPSVDSFLPKTLQTKTSKLQPLTSLIFFNWNLLIFSQMPPGQIAPISGVNSQQKNTTSHQYALRASYPLIPYNRTCQVSNPFNHKVLAI